MKRAVVIGAGFSGLVSAYYLSKEGYAVEVYEKAPRPGGLIQTTITPWGQAESAANGFLASLSLEEIASDIGVELFEASKISRKRYIYRSQARRWPLNILETFIFVFRFLLKRQAPLQKQTVAEWGDQTFGVAGRRYLLSPALQGIYAGDPEKLSASLILGRFFKKNKKRKARGKLRGTVAPLSGMGEFIDRLEAVLKQRGVAFKYGETYGPLNLDFTAPLGGSSANNPVIVIATNAAAAGELLSSHESLARALKQVSLLPVVSVTAFFESALGKSGPELPGFGCLMPRDQGFRVLGVLFNSSIFANRSKHRSETWIFGGATDEAILKLSDEALIDTIVQERARFYAISAMAQGPFVRPLGYRIQRWPEGIPHYTVDLEELLDKHRQSILDLEKNKVFVAGNFLGSLGLSQMLERTREMVERIAQAE